MNCNLFHEMGSRFHFSSRAINLNIITELQISSLTALMKLYGYNWSECVGRICWEVVNILFFSTCNRITG